jgi:hypothetical protein
MGSHSDAEGKLKSLKVSVAKRVAALKFDCRLADLSCTGSEQPLA